MRFGADEFVLSPRYDVVFKAMFTRNTADSRGALMDFLGSVTGREVADVSVQANEPPAQLAGEKQATMDLNCVFNDGDQANVEIQVRRRGNMAPRAEYYLCRLHAGQAVRGQEYDRLHFTYQISILDYGALAPELPFFNEYELRDQEGRPLEGSLTRLYFLELTKLRELLEKPSAQLTKTEKWALFLKYAEDVRKRELINEIIQEEGLAMASRELEQLARDNAMRVTLLSLEKAENDRYNDYMEARKEGRKEGLREGLQKGMEKGMEKGMKKGIEKGIEKGMEKGIEKGKKEGRQEGRQEERKSIVRTMGNAGMSSELIAKTLGLPLEEVQKLLS